MLLNCGVGEVSLDCKEIQPVHPKRISPEYSLEGLMLKLKLQYFGHLRRADSFEKTLMLGKIECGRRRGWQRMRWLNGITNLMDKGLGGLGSLWTGKPGLLHTLSHKELDRTEQLNWTDSFCLYWAIFPFSVLFWDPKFPFHLFFETLNLLIGLCFKSERVQSCNLYARIKILSLTFCML